MPKDFATWMKDGGQREHKKLVEEVFTFLWCGPGVLSISRHRGCLSYVVLFRVESFMSCSRVLGVLAFRHVVHRVLVHTCRDLVLDVCMTMIDSRSRLYLSGLKAVRIA